MTDAIKVEGLTKIYGQGRRGDPPLCSPDKLPIVTPIVIPRPLIYRRQPLHIAGKSPSLSHTVFTSSPHSPDKLHSETALGHGQLSK